MKKTNLVVFSGSNKPNFYDDIYLELKNISDNLDVKKYNLWYGGGEAGLMGIIPYNYHLRGGEVFSVDAKQFVDNYGSASFGKTYIMDTFNERQNNLLSKGDIFLCLPGGVGTMSELFDVLVDNDVNKKNSKIIIYSYNNFYKDIIKFIEEKSKEGFIKSDNLDNIQIFSKSEDIFNFLNNFEK